MNPNIDYFSQGMEYRSPLNAGYSLQDSLASLYNTSLSREWSNSPQRGGRFRQSIFQKKTSTESVPIWQFYHARMLADPWKDLAERGKAQESTIKPEPTINEEPSSTTKLS